MKKTILLMLSLLMVAGGLFSRPVDRETAMQLAGKFAENKLGFTPRGASVEVRFNQVYRAPEGLVTMYVFDVNDGYVIVAADDCSRPILGYSEQGAFSLDHASDGLLFMLEEISNGIAQAVENRLNATADIQNQWRNLAETGRLHASRNTAVVAPLIQQKWNQDAPYNLLCPSGCPTGCVATAMAQIMKYWEWPLTGTGEHSYYCAGYGVQSANFGETTYQWANMLDVYGGFSSEEERMAVAVLMYHCGVAMNMQYEPSGSGAFSADVPEAISTYFSYTEHAKHITKSGYNFDEWLYLLKGYLNQMIPLYYSGQSSSGGHAFICDGYDVDDLFHFNWGWGGSDNGYFVIDGPDFDYTGSQAIVADFVPAPIFNKMPQPSENLQITIDNDVSRIGHLSWTNPSETVLGTPLETIDRLEVRREGQLVQVFENVTPGAPMTYDDEAPYFDQFTYTITAVVDELHGRPAYVKGVFGPYCEWTVIMTSTDFHGWNGGGITVQNAAGSYIDFLTTTTATASMQRFPMALGNNNLYWKAPSSNIASLTFKVKDAENHVVYEYSGPSSDLEEGLLRTLNNSCGNENVCEAPYQLKAEVDPENDSNVILTWESNHEPEFGFCIYRDGILVNMAHTTRFVDENLDPGGHNYYITALCMGGETLSSNEYSVTSGIGYEAPANLRYHYLANGKVMLRWDAPDNENVDAYMVMRRTLDTPFKLKQIVTATSYRDNTVKDTVVYQYAVKAIYDNNHVYSGYANSLFDAEKFYVQIDWIETSGSLFAAFNEDSTAVAMRWEPVYHSQEYHVYRNDSLLASVPVSDDCVYADTLMPESGTLCYRVMAVREGEETDATNEVCLTLPEPPLPPEPPVLPCDAPSNLNLQSHANQQVTIAWTAPERPVDSYTLVRFDNLSQTETTVENLTETSYSLELGPEYDLTFQVKAVYEECESEWALTADSLDFIRVHNLALQENLFGVRLYPNPAHNTLHVATDLPCETVVYDLLGQQVLVSKSKELEFNKLTNGVYFVKVTTEKGTMVQKIIKE